MRHRGPFLDAVEKGQQDVLPNGASSNQSTSRKGSPSATGTEKIQFRKRRRRKRPRGVDWKHLLGQVLRRFPSFLFWLGFFGYISMRASWLLVGEPLLGPPPETNNEISHKDSIKTVPPVPLHQAGDEAPGTATPPPTESHRGKLKKLDALAHEHATHQQQIQKDLKSPDQTHEGYVILSESVDFHSSIRLPPSPFILAPKTESVPSGSPDFGDLAVASDSKQQEKGEDFEEATSDDADFEFAFDDDHVEGLKSMYSIQTQDENASKSCRRVSEKKLHLVNCNEFHQLDRADDALAAEYRYISHGYYREVFSMTHHFGPDNDTAKVQGISGSEVGEKVVVKQINYADGVDMTAVEYTRMDAVVAERLTSSPHIFDVYGLCGGSILSEYFYHGDIKKYIMPDKKGLVGKKGLQDEDDVDPRNSLTPLQKIVLALDMAEGLVQLHGYENGLIIHNDLQPAQYLLNEGKTMLKLNDFNLADFPLWDEDNHQYCRYKNGRDGAIWRSPEEYSDAPRTEQIDVWALGSVYYVILTGLRPLYQNFPQKMPVFRQQIIDGESGYIDPRYAKRSKAEASLVRAIERCFVHNPEERATIFEILDDLRKDVDEILREENTSKEAVLQDLSKND